jgi:hypothetical protein
LTLPEIVRALAKSVDEEIMRSVSHDDHGPETCREKFSNADLKFTEPRNFPAQQDAYGIEESSDAAMQPCGGGSDCPRCVELGHAPARSDPVSHPAHYTSGKIEVWDAIVDWRLDYLIGNAVKYLARAGRKDPTKEVEDLQKAKAYIDRKIAQLKGPPSV